MSLPRRLALLAAGAALVPGLAAAQAPAAGAPQGGVGQVPGSRPSPSAPPGDLAGQSPEGLATLIREAGGLALGAARIGIERARDAEVRRFAQFEVIEQEGVVQALRLAGRDLPDPREEGEAARVLSHLRAVPEAGFDAAFLEAQEAAHQRLLSLTTAVLQSGAPAAERIVALLSNGQAREHLARIAVMQGRG